MRIIAIIMLVLAASACRQPSQKKASETKAGTGDTVKAPFPVTEFIRGQIYLVDSFRSITFRYVTRQNKTDTALISLAEFDTLAQRFLHPDFNDSALSKYYTETSFADQSTRTVIFNYTTREPGLEIRRVDVVVDANPSLYDKVRSIYMEKQRTRMDTVITEKLYWRTDKNFQIISSSQVKGQPESVVITKVVWDG